MVHYTTLNTLSSQSWPSPEPAFAFVKKRKKFLTKITSCSDKLPRKRVTEFTLTTQSLHHCKPEREPAKLWLHAYWVSQQACTLLTALKVALNPVFFLIFSFHKNLQGLQSWPRSLSVQCREVL